METRRVGIVRGGLTLAKARTVPNRMVWVNGCGCQRAYSCRYCAADAEMPVAFRSPRPSGPRVLSGSVLTSRIAGYVIRMSGGVGGALSDGRPYPYKYFSLSEVWMPIGHLVVVAIATWQIGFLLCLEALWLRQNLKSQTQQLRHQLFFP